METTIDVTQLPEHMQERALSYFTHGTPPGSFMRAVLENNLVDAFGQADDINRMRMFDWAAWLYNDLPTLAWGNKTRVATWISHKGLSGFEAFYDKLTQKEKTKDD